MKKLTVFILAAALLALCFCSCGKTPSPADKTDVRVITLKGPTGIGMASLMSEDTAGNTANDYEFTLAASPDEVSSAIIAGTFDIAALPVNLASVLYNKGADVQLIGVNTLGVLYILENGNDINSVDDLRGKTIYATGQGSTPQYVLEYILEKNNIEIGKDVTVEYFAEHAEIAAKLATNSVAIGMLPEPNVTSALISSSSSDGDLRIALDLTDEWEKVSDGTLVQGVIVVSKTFAANNPKAVSDFIKEYKSSVDFVNANIDTAASYCETYGIVPKTAVAKKAIPNCNICLKTNEEAKSYVNSMLGVLFDANPKSVGGKLPADDFYLSVVNSDEASGS